MIVRYVLLVVAMVALVMPVVLVRAGEPTAGATPNAPALQLEHRSRGPPESRCDSPGRRSQFRPVRSIRIASNTRNTRRPGSHLPKILDLRNTTDYNNQPTQHPRRALPGQITANSVDRRTRESMIVHKIIPSRPPTSCSSPITWPHAGNLGVE
jgi:hypothetical protein